MKMYKLVSQEIADGKPQWTTRGGMRWEIGVTNKATAEGNVMCSNQVLHCYSNPYLAVLFNPIHANIFNPALLEIECSEIVATDRLKHACKEQTPIKEIVLPILTTRQRVLFAIKCALAVYKAADFVAWANGYISGKDVSVGAADAAARAAARAARAAAVRTARAARAAAALSADADAYAAYATLAADAAYAAACAAAYADADADSYAVYTARAAACAAAYTYGLDFVEIIQWTLEQIRPASRVLSHLLRD